MIRCVIVPSVVFEASLATASTRAEIFATASRVPAWSLAIAAANFVASNSIAPFWVIVMPMLDGETPLTTSITASLSRVARSRTPRSPVKAPALVFDPVPPFVTVTADFWRMVVRMLSTPLTSACAADVAFAEFRAIVSVTGAASTADTVTATPGSRSANELVFDVISCAALEPAQRVTAASCAVLTVAAPEAASTSGAVAAVTSAEVPS